MIRVAVVGATGYAGAEIVRILCNHPGIRLTMLTSRQYAGVAFDNVFPSMTGSVSLVCETLDVTPEQTIMVGDTTMDIIAGKKANCKTIGVLWGAMSMDKLSEAGVDFLARNPKELEDLLKYL